MNAEQRVKDLEQMLTEIYAGLGGYLPPGDETGRVLDAILKAADGGEIDPIVPYHPVEDAQP